MFSKYSFIYVLIDQKRNYRKGGLEINQCEINIQVSISFKSYLLLYG
jgi:hypothetical protein